MRTRTTMLFWGGMLAAGFAVAPASEEEGARGATGVARTDAPLMRDVPLNAATLPGRGVITLGPLEAPLLPPRVRVANDRSDVVNVFYVVEATGAWRRLGSVSGMATEAFQVPESVGTIRLVLAPVGSEEAFVSGWIGVDEGTDMRPPRRLGGRGSRWGWCGWCESARASMNVQRQDSVALDRRAGARPALRLGERKSPHREHQPPSFSQQPAAHSLQVPSSTAIQRHRAVGGTRGAPGASDLK
jgi:hypothetical protein